jgi:WD40 repeat protein
VPISIFCCYARKDEALLDELITHLSPLQREGLIEVWCDREIPGGAEWNPEIQKHLNAAQIILLLISPDFMRSDYCYDIEMKRALEQHERREAIAIPVILRPVEDWRRGPLGKLQALPTDGKPITGPDWYNLDQAFNNVTTGIYKVVERLTARQAHASPFVTEEAQPMVIPDHMSIPMIHWPIPTFSFSWTPPAVEKLTLLRTLTDHTGTVTSVAISSDGKTLVSGSEDRTIKVWDLSTGKAVHTLTGHTGAVESVAISGDGKTLVSGSKDVTIRVWELPTGKESRPLNGHTGAIESVAISGDGNTLVSGSWDGIIKVWELSTGKVVRTLPNHKDVVWSVAISDDGNTLVSGSHDSTVRVWKLSTDKVMPVLNDYRYPIWSGEIRSVAISQNGKTLVYGGGDLNRTIQVRKLPTCKEGQALTGHTSDVTSVAISGDGNTLVSGSMDGTIKVWKLPIGKEVQTLTSHIGPVWSVAISRDGKTLVSGGQYGEIKVWGIEGTD